MQNVISSAPNLHAAKFLQRHTLFFTEATASVASCLVTPLDVVLLSMKRLKRSVSARGSDPVCKKFFGSRLHEGSRIKDAQARLQWKRRRRRKARRQREVLFTTLLVLLCRMYNQMLLVKIMSLVRGRNPPNLADIDRTTMTRYT